LRKSYLLASKVKVGVILSHEWCSKNNTSRKKSRIPHHYLTQHSIDIVCHVSSRGDVVYSSTDSYENVREVWAVLVDVG